MTKLLFNGSQFPNLLPGIPDIKIDGRLTYVFNGEERTAWINRDDQSKPNWRRGFDYDRLMEYSESIPDSSYLILDVEHYRIDMELGLHIDIIETIRHANPSLQIGLFSVLPQSNYHTVADYAAWLDFKEGRPHNDQTASWWAHPNGGLKAIAEYKGWQDTNVLIARKLGPHLNFIAPSIYPAVEPPKDKIWMGAREPQLMVKECRRLFGRSKPCIPVWQPNMPDAVTLASNEYSQAVIKAMAQAADGLAVWMQPQVGETLAHSILSMVNQTMDAQSQT